MNWGIVSASRISHRWIQAVQLLGKDVVYGVASRDLARGEALQKQYAIPKLYDSYKALYQDPAIDAVYISNVNNYHYQAVMEAISYGKHVVCEKPLAVSAGEALQMIRAAKTANVFFMEALWTRFLPIYTQIRETIAKGTIGQIQQVRADFSFVAERNEAWRLLNPDLGGGALYDIGIYAIMFLLDFLGTDVKGVQATGFVGPTGVDEESVVTLDYGEGILGVAMLSFRSRRPRLGTIFGTKGQIDIPDFYAANRATVLQYDTGAVSLLEAESVENKFVYEVAAARRCILEGKKQAEQAPLAHSLCAAQVIDAALRQIYGQDS